MSGSFRSEQNKNIYFENPLVSVVIPAYNCEHYIKATVMSVIEQTYKNIEIIIINDGSSDGTESVCQALAEYR